MSRDNTQYLFYAGQLYGEYPYQEWVAKNISCDTPDGAYLYEAGRKTWYIRRFSSFTTINLCDVPTELQMLCLLLDIPLK